MKISIIVQHTKSSSNHAFFPNGQNEKKAASLADTMAPFVPILAECLNTCLINVLGESADLNFALLPTLTLAQADWSYWSSLLVLHSSRTIAFLSPK